jgi:hypothetical protein
VQRCADYFGMAEPAEFVAAATFFTLMIALKLVNITHYRFDSDESQHMHVIWAWARGFIQYRDVFDNHMPFFQIMFAPIFGLRDLGGGSDWSFHQISFYFVRISDRQSLGATLASVHCNAAQ